MAGDQLQFDPNEGAEQLTLDGTEVTSAPRPLAGLVGVHCTGQTIHYAEIPRDNGPDTTVVLIDEGETHEVDL